MYGTNASTCWARCTNFNLHPWKCDKGLQYCGLCCAFLHFFDADVKSISLQIIFPYNWSWTTSLLLGGLLSATDPVAVVALLKDLGASKKLSTIIEGESLMNDGYRTYWSTIILSLFVNILYSSRRLNKVMSH